MLNLKAVAVLAGALLLTACASGPKYADVKSSFPPLAADKGRIYFYRPSNAQGAAIQPSIMLNGEKVGNSKPGGFFYVDRAPGGYEISCSTEVVRKTHLTLAAGQERYVETNITAGFLAGHVRPEVMDPEEGAVAIQSMHYAPMKDAKK